MEALEAKRKFRFDFLGWKELLLGVLSFRGLLINFLCEFPDRNFVLTVEKWLPGLWISRLIRSILKYIYSFSLFIKSKMCLKETC